MQHEKYNVQHGKSAPKAQHENSVTRKKVQYEKIETWKKCNSEKVQHEMSTARKKCYSKIVKNEKSTTRESATRKVYNKKKWNLKRVQYKKSATQKKCNMKQHEKRDNMKRVQHTKRCNMKRVQHQKSATWKECNMKKWNTEKVLHEMSATHKKSATWSSCNMKQNEKRCAMKRVIHAKKVHKNTALDCTNGQRAVQWRTVIHWFKSFSVDKAVSFCIIRVSQWLHFLIHEFLSSFILI